MKNYLAKLLGYTVWCPQFDAMHHSFTFKEALSWAACYDCGAAIYKGNTFIAYRKTLNHS